MYKGQVLLAILDFMPVILFGIGAVYLLRLACHYLSRTFYTIMAGGAVLCFFGGLYKAASKVLEMAWDYCIPAIQNSQFIMLAPGFLMMFIASIRLVMRPKQKSLVAVAPGMELWKIPFIAVMSLANIGFLVCMAIFSLKNKVRLPITLYLSSLVMLFLMSFLATQPMTIEIQWLAQGINTLIQLMTMTGHMILFHALIGKGAMNKLGSAVENSLDESLRGR